MRLLLTISYKQWVRNNGHKALIIMAACFGGWMFYMSSISNGNADDFDYRPFIPIQITFFSALSYMFLFIDKRKPMAMDSFVRTRPISNKASNLFMLITSLSFSDVVVLPAFCANSFTKGLELGEAILAIAVVVIVMVVSCFFKMLLKQSKNSGY